MARHDAGRRGLVRDFPIRTVWCNCRGKPEVAWLAADLVDERSGGWPRRRVICSRSSRRRRRQRGFQVKTGVECEFFLTTAPMVLGRFATPQTGRAKPLLRPVGPDAPVRHHRGDFRRHAWRWAGSHTKATMRMRTVSSKMNWEYDDTLITADRHSFFKYMAKSVAEEARPACDVHAEAVFSISPASGCHAHVSLLARRARNLFEKRKPANSASSDLGLSLYWRDHSLGGRAMRAVQSDRELVQAHQTRHERPRVPTWAPNTVTYTGNNRNPHDSVSLKPGGFELRLADAAGQSVPAAGRNYRGRHRWHREQARPWQAARYQHVHRRTFGEETPSGSPSTCSMRFRALGKSATIKGSLGEFRSIITLKLKHEEWNRLLPPSYPMGA